MGYGVCVDRSGGLVVADVRRCFGFRGRGWRFGYGDAGLWPAVGGERRCTGLALGVKALRRIKEIFSITELGVCVVSDGANTLKIEPAG